MATVGDVGITIRKAADLYNQLKTTYNAPDCDLDKCEELITSIKKCLIFFPTFMNPAAESATAVQEVTLSREVLEHAVLIAARRKDLNAFEAAYMQLRSCYNDVTDGAVAKSERQYLITGLNLMRLLVTSKIAAFHSELEVIPFAEHKNMYIRFPILLERYLVEGSYNKLLHARSQVPSNEYIAVVELFEDTVRYEVQQCIPRSYARLSLDEAQKMMMLSSREEVAAIGKKNEWQVSEDGAYFVFCQEEAIAKHEIPYREMLQHHISFAADLQRVV